MTPAAMTAPPPTDRSPAGAHVKWEVDPYRLASELRRRISADLDRAALELAQAIDLPTSTVRRWLDLDRPASMKMGTAWRVVDALNGSTTTRRGHLLVTGWGATCAPLAVGDLLTQPWWARR